MNFSNVKFFTILPRCSLGERPTPKKLIRVESRWGNGGDGPAGAGRQGRSLFAIARRPYVNHIRRKETSEAIPDRIATEAVRG